MGNAEDRVAKLDNAAQDAIKKATGKSDAERLSQGGQALGMNPTVVVDTPISRSARGIGGITRKKTEELGIIRFPLNVEDKNLPYVLFKIFETQSGTIQDNPAIRSAKSQSEASLTSGVVSTINKAKSIGGAINNEILGGVLGRTAGAVGEAAVSAADAVGNTVFDIPNFSNKLKESFANFTLNRNSEQLALAIALFMPDGLATSYDQQYDELSLTATLGAAGLFSQAMSTETGAMEAKDPFLVEAASKLAGSIPGLQSSQELTSLLLFGSSGRTINPQLEMIYSSPRLRTFTFDFRLVPRNSVEAETINGIIKNLKFFAAPTIESGSTGRYFIPPARFEIEFYHNEKPNDYLFKTKQCVLESINLDYAPNGYASHWDGAPVETRMSLTFKETTIIDRNAIEEGY